MNKIELENLFESLERNDLVELAIPISGNGEDISKFGIFLGRSNNLAECLVIDYSIRKSFIHFTRVKKL